MNKKNAEISTHKENLLNILSKEDISLNSLAGIKIVLTLENGE